MFDFENLEVYKKAKAFNSIVNKSVLRIESLDGVTKNQLRRASLSVVLNIAKEPAVSANLTEGTFA